MSNTINIKRSSTSHVALLYLKMKNTFVTVEDVFQLSPSKYEHKYRAQRSLNTLVRQGLAICRDNMYHITHEGKAACFKIVREQPAHAYE